MNFINNLKIGTRLTITLCILLALTVLIGAESLIKASSIQSSIVDITQRRMVLIAHLNDLRLEVNRQSRFLRNMVIINESEKINNEHKAILDSRGKSERLLKLLYKEVHAPKGLELLNKAVEANGFVA